MPSEPLTRPLSFDRAADFYDATRDLDEDARGRLTGILADELAGRTCLEVGIGTGLVGLALARRGVPMWGVDLSAKMLAKLVAKFERPAEVKLVRASATALPFAGGSFDAVLTSQMLHLVEDWRDALHELTRVVKPEGPILIDLGNEPDSGWGGPWAEVAKKFWEYARPQGRHMPEVWVDGVVREQMRHLGFVSRPLPRVEAFEMLSLGDIISRLEQGLWSACWALPPEVIHHAATHTRSWAQETYGVLDRAYRVRRVIQYWVYERTS